MSTVEAIRAAPIDQRLVLLAVAEASRDRDTPLNPAELRSVCNDRLTGDDRVVGGLSEADVTRALYALEAEDLVDDVAGETSPAGKGRPAYELVPEPSEVREALAARDDLAPLVEDLD